MARGGPRERLRTRPIPYPRFDGPRPCMEVGPDAFVTDGTDRLEDASLQRICVGCPFIDPCREFAISYDVRGVWGGTTYAERRRARTALRIKVIPVALSDAGMVRERIAKLDDGTRSLREIAQEARCSPKTVERYRAVAA